MKKILCVAMIVVSAILVSALFAFARTSAATPEPSDNPDNGLAVKAQIETASQQFQKNMEYARTQLENKIQQKRTELDTRLSKIVDDTKRTLVEKIDTQMDDLNSTMTSHFSDVLSHLQAVLTKISDRADTDQAAGYDVSAVRTAITAASKALDAAHTAVTAQASKTYIMQVTDAGTLKQAVGNARQNLHGDLVNVRAVVQAAFDAVHNAAVALGQLKIKPSESPTESPSPSSSISPSASPSPSSSISPSPSASQ